MSNETKGFHAPLTPYPIPTFEVRQSEYYIICNTHDVFQILTVLILFWPLSSLHVALFSTFDLEQDIHRRLLSNVENFLCLLTSNGCKIYELKKMQVSGKCSLWRQTVVKVCDKIVLSQAKRQKQPHTAWIKKMYTDDRSN